MFKLLVIILLAGAVAYLLLRSKKLASRRAPMEVRRKSIDGEKMLDCARCGLRFPESEAVRGADGRSYCCDEHARLGQPSRR